MLLTVENLNLTFDKKVIFKDANFRILENEKIGVIGNNGVGKSTLIQVLCGKILPDSGSIIFDKKIKVGYLDQYMKINKNLTIEQYLKEAFKELYLLNDELNKQLDTLSKTSDEELMTKLIKSTTSLREELERSSFYALNSKIARIASGLGVTNYGMNNIIGHLSGGQKMKVILTKLLLEEPDLLILDEPTNFLDTIHVDWLVKYLKEYKGNFFIVSHNQEFLNNVVNVIMEVEFGKITRYKGNYEQYLVKKAMIEKNQVNEYAAQTREIKALNDYIQKNKVRTSTARQAQSRQKKLDKIVPLDKPKSEDIHISLSFNYKPIYSHKFLEVTDLEIGYDCVLLPQMNFTIKSGEKLAITGFNGIGKSTLLKTLVGELIPIGGKFHFVDDALISYFEQEHHFDDPSLTPLQEISNLYPMLEEKVIRTNLAKCGIRGATALQTLKTLSGGEQAKVKLCKLMMKKANVLILDEPTNHLDKIAKEELLQSLKKYQGTIIFATHEKDFLEKLATRIYNIEDLLL